MVAALPLEFAGIPSRPAPLRGVWSHSAGLGPHHAFLVANGAGTHRAAAAFDAALSVFRPDAVVSTGFCGALAPHFQVADIVVGTAAGPHPAQPVASDRPHHTGPVSTIDHVAQTAAEKRRLAAAGAIAVDMEASGVAARAQAMSLPFYCIKAVTDLAGENLANDLNKALRPDGHFATILLLRGLLRHPWVRLPELVRLRNRSTRAARSLGEFLADCRY